MSDLDTRLREALHDLAPEDPSAAGLADGARRLAARARRLHQLGLAATTAATLVLAAVLVSSFDPPDRVVPAGPRLTPADCTRQAAVTSAPTIDETTTGAVEAWVCPDPAATPGTTIASGWRLPDHEVTAPHVAQLDITGRASGLDCAGVQPGPAFTLTLASGAGQLRTFRSRDLGCGGAHTLASFLGALAGAEVDSQPASTAGAALACRTEATWLRTHETASLTDELHAPLVVATLCLAPSFLSGDPQTPVQPLAARSYRAVPLPAATLALLNADLTSAWGGFFTGNGTCITERPWTYAIVGRTSAGDERMLRTGCLDELWVTGVDRTGFIPTAATTAALEALVPPA